MKRRDFLSACGWGPVILKAPFIFQEPKKTYTLEMIGTDGEVICRFLGASLDFLPMSEGDRRYVGSSLDGTIQVEFVIDDKATMEELYAQGL